MQTGPHRLEAKDAGFSGRKRRFESSWGHQPLSTLQIALARHLPACFALLRAPRCARREGAGIWRTRAIFADSSTTCISRRALLDLAG